MNLIIDIGNTLTKVAVFQNDGLLYRCSFERELFLEKIEKIFQDYPETKAAILSSVVKSTKKEEDFLKKHISLCVLSPDLKLPFSNAYATPETLGKDRIALIAGAVKKYPKKNVLVVDAGTCVTYDLKTGNETYLGGAISPGLDMRFKAMHKFTGKLPLVKRTEDVKSVGNSTESSLQSGGINGLAYEIDTFIERYSIEYKYLTVILTGGDMQFLCKQLKNSIFANPILLLEGLNYILEFNKTQ